MNLFEGEVGPVHCDFLAVLLRRIQAKSRIRGKGDRKYQLVIGVILVFKKGGYNRFSKVVV